MRTTMNFTIAGVPIGGNISLCQRLESLDPAAAFNIVMIFMAVVYAIAAFSVLWPNHK